MTRDEFLFDHDVVGVSEMINQVLRKNDDQKNDSGAVSAVNFL